MIEKLTHERPDTTGDLHKKYIKTNQSEYPLSADSSPEDGLVFIPLFDQAHPPESRF